MVFTLALVRFFLASKDVVCSGLVKSFVVIKVITGVNPPRYVAKRRGGMEAREVADVVNDFGRDPKGGREGGTSMYSSSRSFFLLDLTDFAALKGIQ